MIIQSHDSHLNSERLLVRTEFAIMEHRKETVTSHAMDNAQSTNLHYLVTQFLQLRLSVYNTGPTLISGIERRKEGSFTISSGSATSLLPFWPSRPPISPHSAATQRQIRPFDFAKPPYTPNSPRSRTSPLSPRQRSRTCSCPWGEDEDGDDEVVTTCHGRLWELCGLNGWASEPDR